MNENEFASALRVLVGEACLQESNYEKKKDRLYQVLGSEFQREIDICSRFRFDKNVFNRFHLLLDEDNRSLRFLFRLGSTGEAFV